MRFEWGALLRAGVREAGLRPDDLWRLTPMELALILGREAVAAPMSREALAALARAWPDEGDGHG